MSKKGILSKFKPVFWLANIMELFERAAYYGMNSVLAVYLTDKLHFQHESVGFLQAIVYALTYIVPIVGGALAEKYGYKRMLIIAFSFLSFGYFAAGNFTTYGIIFTCLLLVGVGSGLFKPIISSTIARTTDEETSGFGFGIYYWMINLGAFIAPLLVSYLKGFSWRYVFMASAAWAFLMLFPSIFLYKEPEGRDKDKSLKESLKNIIVVLGDSRFMLLIFIYSFFWIIYFQNFGSVLWYLRDFINRAVISNSITGFFHSIGLNINFVFDVEHVTVINAGTIILLQVLISRLVKKVKPLPTMITGILIGSSGFLILALTKSAWLFILGIAVFSIGEMTTHPKYYSYIGLIAPKDKVAVYMGYAFIYGVIGSLFGSSIGATLYEEIAKKGNNPKLFFMLFFILGVLSSIGLVLYNRFFMQDNEKTNRRAYIVMFGFYILITLLGLLFVYNSFAPTGIIWKRILQSSILLLVGLGGIGLSLKKRS
jgi:dipeptide/tripeptide permease